MEYSVARKAFIITLILYMPWNQDDVTELYGQSVLHNKEGYDSLVCAYISKAVAQQIFQGAQKGNTWEVRSPTGNVLGAAAKNLGAQIISLGTPGC